MKSRIFTVVALVAMIVASSAFAAGKGSSMLTIGLGQNQANTVGGFSLNPFGNKFDETNVGAQYQRMLSDDYAFALSGAYGFGSAKIALTPTGEGKLSLSGYRFRVGGDRVGKVGERFTLYLGPGIEYSSAKLKGESTGSPAVESENATTWAISGRIGGIMMLSPKVGIQGEINHNFGYASEKGIAASGIDKVTWYPNSTGAFWGLTFMFGSE